MKSLIAILWFGLVLGQPMRAAAQANDDCFACHGDKDLKARRNGGSISLFVDQTRFEASIHGKAACTDCHADLAKKELPHDAALAKVSCARCHAREGRQQALSAHAVTATRSGVTAPQCADCHGTHEIVAIDNAASPVLPARVSTLCGQCHTEGSPVHRPRALSAADAPRNFSERIHGDVVARKGLNVAATCVSCHTAHNVQGPTDDRATVSRRNIAATCSACHSRLDQVHARIIPAERFKGGPETFPVCVDCHEPHRTSRTALVRSVVDRGCVSCHERPDLTSARSGRSMFVDVAALGGSMHAKLPCAQCHSDIDPSHAKASGAPAKPVVCASCHVGVADQYRQSTHGQLEAKHDDNAPSCVDCHGTHGVLGRYDPASPTFPINIPTLCAGCHRTGQKAAVRYKGKQTEIVQHYTESIHGKGLIKSGLIVTAMCTSCHTAHFELPRDNPKSSVNPANVPATCGACHAGIEGQFDKSVHSSKVTKTATRLPVCNDCHSAHTISRTDADGFKQTIMNQCGTCHEELTRRYFETYHGKVSQLGYYKTAQCYDCHGSHEILPVNDPRSHLSGANRVATCQKCHPGTNARFAGYLAHATPHDRRRYPELFWAFWGMTGLLVGTFAFFWAHTLLWLPRSLKLRREVRAHAAAVSESEPQYERFTRFNRALHIAMIVSFLALATTGLSLKFSYTSWASALAHLLGGFESAGFIHRFSALVMIVVFVSHLVELARRKGSTWKEKLFGPNTMLPMPKDIRDLIANVKWFVGRGERPKFGRWTYWEKFDYFGVFWGMAIIGGTGLILWFPGFFTRLLPGWTLNVATIIHSDEALLATGFIFTIHFFNTHLRPEKFPMDLVIFTGRMPVEELKDEKPLEYEALMKKGELDQHLVLPYPPIVIRAIRAFAGMALAIGVLLAVWIVYALLFAGH